MKIIVMNKGKNISFIAFAIATMFLVSCGGGNATKKGGGTKKFTSLSGWKPNDARGWFFNPKKKKPKAWENMVYVEGGSFVMGQVKDDVIKDWNNSPKRIAVSSYFIGETEVTNYEYREYITWLKVVFPPENEEYREIYFGSLPDSLVWDNYLAHNESYTEQYFRRVNFNYYPVVGVNWLQASNYCDWLTDRANEYELIKTGILDKEYYTNEDFNLGAKHFTEETYRYNQSEVKEAIDTAKVAKINQIKNTNKRVQSANRSTASSAVTAFRLPTEAEWEFAALGLAARREYNNYKGKPVLHNELRERKGRGKGQFVANFKRGRGNYAGIAGYGNDGATTTADVRQYASNDIGVYGMYGNVAEWTADVYRPIVDDELNDIDYVRGNIYKSKIRQESGFKILEEGEVEFDTLNDGRLTYKSLPGDYQQEVVLDARNYRDGDYLSSLEAGVTPPETAGEDLVYNAPERKFYVDENGRVILEKDSEFRTTEIDDELRVIKGGSWKDPIYWIDPGQRRYLNEADAKSWLGFRVAQDSNGTGVTSTSAYGAPKGK